MVQPEPKPEITFLAMVIPTFLKRTDMYKLVIFCCVHFCHPENLAYPVFFSVRHNSGETQFTMSTNFYFIDLLSQGRADICPTCFKTGNRKKCCTNPVYVQEGLVCCYLADKDKISKEEFDKKVEEIRFCNKK